MTQQDRGKLARDSIFMVVISLVLYRLMFTNILFILPLLVVAPRFEDRRMALLPVAATFLLIVGSQVFQSRSLLGEPVAMLVLVIGLFIPVVLLAAAAVWIWLREARYLVRFLASCIMAVGAGTALAVWLNSGSAVVGELRELYSQTFQALFGVLSPITEPLIENGEVAQAAVETTVFGIAPQVLFEMCLQVIYHTFVPMCMAMIGYSELLSQSMTYGRDVAWQERVSNWRLRVDFIWVFLGSWTLVLLAWVMKMPSAVFAVGMNLALAVSLLYMVQGLSIVLFWMRRRNGAYTMLKLVMFVTLFLILPGMNALVVLALTLIGALETWIIMRKND